MDGVHDIGGCQGFGPVVKLNKTRPYKENWEVKINAISGRLVGKHIINMDQYRHGVERMEPRHYLSSSYFERVFISVLSLCVEKNILTTKDLKNLNLDKFQRALPSTKGRFFTGTLENFKIGDRVRVKSESVAGHVRIPGYVRGKEGFIVGVSPAFDFPDAAAHELEAEKQKTYDVCFKTTDLWSDAEEGAEVHVGLFHSYLEII